MLNTTNNNTNSNNITTGTDLNKVTVLKRFNRLWFRKLSNLLQ